MSALDAEEPKRKGCDVDDILCELELLQNLRGLRKSIGAERFQERFPQLNAIEPQLKEEISISQEKLKKALEQCGTISTDVLGDIIKEADESFPSEEPEGD